MSERRIREPEHFFGKSSTRRRARDTPRDHCMPIRLGLPGLSGFDVAARLREQPECRGALLVALNGYGRDEDHRQSRSAGFDHHLTKPVDLKVLTAFIEQRRLV